MADDGLTAEQRLLIATLCYSTARAGAFGVASALARIADGRPVTLGTDGTGGRASGASGAIALTARTELDAA